MPPDPLPAPIRGRWTIQICRRCGDHHDPEQHGEVCGCLHETGVRTLIDVEVVPVPDEAAIERGAKASRDRRKADVAWHADTDSFAVYFHATGEVVSGYDSLESAARDVDRLVALAVLRAALECE